MDIDNPPSNINFYFPVFQLENYKIRLVPYSPALHAEAIFEAVAPHPDLFTYLPCHPFTSAANLSEYFENRTQKDLSTTLFVVFDKTHLGANRPALAGIIALLETNPNNLVTEIGWVLTVPEFQRTHITTNAVGLLLHYCLDTPTTTILDDPISGATRGLGLRRVQWQANQDNIPSIRAATRLGFNYEGTLRWQRTILPGKIGAKSRAADSRLEYPGRHTTILGLCWDDWENGARDKVRALMAR